MKISQRLRQVQYLSAHDKITSFSGLKHITDLAQRLGVLKALERITVKKRRRGIPVTDFVMSVVQTMIVGGSNLSDLEVLRGERGTRRHLYELEVPAPTTAGERIRTFTLGHIRQLESAITKGLRKLVLQVGWSGPLTLDVDSSIFEVHGYLKEGARYGYTKEKGFHPLLAFWAETRLLIGLRLRAGNRHTADGVLSFLGECLGRLPEGERVRLRLDSGFYDYHVVEYAEAKRLEFSISAMLTKALQDAIDGRPEDRWRAYPWEEGSQWTEFAYQPKRWSRPYRMLVKRNPFYVGEQPVLGEYYYTAVITNRRGAGSSLLRHHLARGGAENYIEEFKNGFGARRLPSQKFLANWTWLTLGMLAYNLVQAFKLLVLPRSEQPTQIKALRLHWFCVAARLIRTGRRWRAALARAPDTAERFHRAQAILHAL